MQLYYQTAILGRRDLALAPDPKSGFEMTLLRMLAFRPAAEGPRTGAAAPAPGRRSEVAPAVMRDATPRAEAAAAPAAAPAAAAGAWAQTLSALEISGATRQLAQHCVFIARQGAVVRLALDPRNQLLRTPALEEKLAQALARHYGEPVRLEFQAVAAGAETPAQARLRASDEELSVARRAFEEDAGVKGLRERFGATVLPDTVRPVK